WGRCMPRAMFTARISSWICTAPLPSQSPTQCGAMVGVGVGVVEVAAVAVGVPGVDPVAVGVGLAPAVPPLAVAVAVAISDEETICKVRSLSPTTGATDRPPPMAVPLKVAIDPLRDAKVITSK